MCIGIPMQVLSVRPGFAEVQGRGEHKTVNIALVDAPQPGDWLLIFLDSAREHITPERAAEVNATLDLVASAMSGLDPNGAQEDAAFDLPSAMSAEQLAAFVGHKTPQETP